MNLYQTELFTQLQALADSDNDAFFVVDQIKDGVHYRIFSYRIASYSDFLLPGALESRGTMFRMRDGHPDALVCQPFKKFFNLNENPMTMNVSFDGVKFLQTKADGSLISSYYHDGRVALKSKASLESQQARDATEWLYDQYHKGNRLLIEIDCLTYCGITVNMEWVSPTNRIVLGYARPDLIVLGMRDTNTGKPIYISDLPSNFTALREHAVKDHRTNVGNVAEFIEAVPHMEGIEGFVVTLHNDLLVKVKTDWYLTRHRLKDSINNAKHLLEAIITEATDDLKSLFAQDPVTLEQITNAEELVIPRYNRMMRAVTEFYTENRDLDRKSYAIKARDLNDGLMSLYMNQYLGRPCNYVEYALKHPDQFIGELMDNGPEHSDGPWAEDWEKRIETA